MIETKNGILKTAAIGLGAGLAGAALALVLAPQSGKRTRRRIRKWGGTLVTRAEDFRDDVSERLEDLVEEFDAAKRRGLEKGRNLSVQVRTELLKPLQLSREIVSKQVERAESIFRD